MWSLPKERLCLSPEIDYGWRVIAKMSKKLKCYRDTLLRMCMYDISQNSSDWQVARLIWCWASPSQARRKNLWQKKDLNKLITYITYSERHHRHLLFYNAIFPYLYYHHIISKENYLLIIFDNYIETQREAETTNIPTEHFIFKIKRELT